MLTKSRKPFDTTTIARLLNHEDEHGMGRVFMYAFLNEVVRQKRPFPFDCESAQVRPNLMIVDNQGRSIIVEYMRNRLSLTLNDQRTEAPALIEYKGKAYRQVLLAWLTACIQYTSLQPELRKELTRHAQSMSKKSLAYHICRSSCEKPTRDAIPPMGQQTHSAQYLWLFSVLEQQIHQKSLL